MAVYIISDTHFNHQAMLKLCWRPANFEERLLSWLRQLKSTDILIHLWDICLTWDREAHEKYIMPLVCTKILVRGNHDRKTNTWYQEHGWNFICSEFKDELYNHKITFSHQPLSHQSLEVLNVHWHRHNRAELAEAVPNYNGVLYGPELYNYLPIKLDRLLHLNKKI